MPDRPRVAVAITTFRRTDLLPGLLGEVRRQIDERERDAQVRIVVVDNDPDCSAADVTRRFGADYAPEARPGIASARQRVLDETADDDAVVMLDDDVVPESGWLDAILDVWTRYRPSVVMGYVRWIWPDLHEPVIEKVRAGGFMRRPDVRTGTRQDWLATGNVLIDSAEVRRLGLHFDVSLGLSGGEDTLFGRLAVQRGGTIVAARESCVSSPIPPDRATAEFAHRRAVGQGTSISHLRLRHEHGTRRLALSTLTVASGLVRIVVFTGARLVGRVTGNPAMEGKHLRKSWTAQGRIRGAIGHVSDEYARDQESA